MSLALVVAESNALAWIAGLTPERLVYFPQPAPDGGMRFAPVATDAKLAFAGYRATVLPPGKVFAPSREVLFTFAHQADGSFRVTPVHDDRPRVVAGLRPCDLKGVTLMDRVNRAGDADPHYLARRDATSLVAYRCDTPCSERCFCATVGALDWEEGADVLLTPVDGDVLVEPRTPAGEALVASLHGATPCADPAALRARHRAARPTPFGRQLPDSPEALTESLERAWNSPLWREHTERCLSCGTCNLVCPTCYCFDTYDEVDVSKPTTGHRCRTWDSCMLPEFAVVADGHDFRRDVAARQRHRVKRKFEYLPRQLDTTFCVGCGRCGAQCTVGIDIFDIAKDVLEQHPAHPTAAPGSTP